MRLGTVFDDVRQDVQYALRALRRAPGFTAVVVLTLALGVGANTAIFQLLDAVRLRTLPVPRAHELAEVRLADALGGGRTGQFSGPRPMLTNPLWEQIRDRQQGFSGIFAWGTVSLDLASGGEERPAYGLWVSGEYFTTLGVGAAAGRVFTKDDDRRGCGTDCQQFAIRASLADGRAGGRRRSIQPAYQPFL